MEAASLSNLASDLFLCTRNDSVDHKSYLVFIHSKLESLDGINNIIDAEGSLSSYERGLHILRPHIPEDWPMHHVLRLL